LAAAACLLLAAGVGAAGKAGSNGAVAGADQPPAFYYRPTAASSRAVLIAPNIDESKESWVLLADSLRGSGFHVLVTDAGVAEEHAASRMARHNRSDPGQPGEDAVAIDVPFALRYLRDLQGVRVSEIAFVGSGSGCSAILVSPRIDFERVCYVLLSPRGDWRGWTDVAPAGLADSPILVIAAKDDLLSLEASAAILREVPQQECWIVDGRGRGVELLRSRTDLVSHIAAWIVRSGGVAGEEP
jgi:hypothetical protein